MPVLVVQLLIKPSEKGFILLWEYEGVGGEPEGFREFGFRLVQVRVAGHAAGQLVLPCEVLAEGEVVHLLPLVETRVVDLRLAPGSEPEEITCHEPGRCSGPQWFVRRVPTSAEQARRFRY